AGRGLRQRPRRAADARRVLEDPEAVRPHRAAAAHAEPTRAAPLVRYAPARERRRPACDSADAGTRRSLDDANLHARARNTPAEHLRSLPPTCVILLNLTVSRHRRSASHEP